MLGSRDLWLGCAPVEDEACPAKAARSPGDELVRGTVLFFSFPEGKQNT